MTRLQVVTRSGKVLVESLQVDGKDVSDLQQAFHAVYPKYAPCRQRFTLPTAAAEAGKSPKRRAASTSPEVKAVVLESNQTLSYYGLKDGDVLVFKDLGPQVSWTVVFLVEYFGPLWIHPLFYFLPQYVYFGSSRDWTFARSHLQSAVLGMVLFHFVKRELETLFVHRFSHATMPLFNLFKNSFHYWILSGVLLAYDVYSPGFTQHTLNEPWSHFHSICVAVWLFAELSNLSTHWTLRQLRPAGSTVRRIPLGYGWNPPFSLSCPNYFFEALGWVAIVVLSRSWGAALFAVASTVQMYVWAVKKHKSYKKEFDKYPKNRKAMFPYLA